MRSTWFTRRSAVGVLNASLYTQYESAAYTAPIETAVQGSPEHVRRRVYMGLMQELDARRVLQTYLVPDMKGHDS